MAMNLTLMGENFEVKNSWTMLTASCCIFHGVWVKSAVGRNENVPRTRIIQN